MATKTPNTDESQTTVDTLRAEIIELKRQLQTQHQDLLQSWQPLISGECSQNTLAQLLSELAQALHVDAVNLYSYNPQQDSYSTRAAFPGVEVLINEENEFPSTVYSYCHPKLLKGERLVISSLDDLPSDCSDRGSFIELQQGCLLGIPIMLRDTLLGLLEVHMHNHQPRQWTNDDIELIEQAAPLIHQASQKIKSQEFQQWFNKASEALASAENLETLEHYLGELSRLLKVDVINLVLPMYEEPGMVKIVCRYPPDPDQNPESLIISAQESIPWLYNEMCEGRYAAIEELDQLPAAAHIDKKNISDRGLGEQSSLGLPLLHNGKLEAMLDIYTIDRKRHWSTVDIHQAQKLLPMLLASYRQLSLRESRQDSITRLNMVLETTKVAYCLFNTDFSDFFYSEGTIKLLGYPSTQTLSPEWVEEHVLWDAEMIAEDSQWIADITNGQNPPPIVYRMRNAQGQPIWLSGDYRAYSHKANGEIEKIMIGLSDITQQVLQQQQVEKNVQQEQWLNQRVDKLYRSPYPIAPCVNEVLADLCQLINGEQAILYYPCINNPDIYNLSYEWCEDKANSLLTIPGYEASYNTAELPEDIRLSLNEVQMINDVSKLSPADKKRLVIDEADPVKAALMLPLFGIEGMCGHVAITCFNDTKQWTKQDQLLIQSIGNAITMAHNREQTHLQLHASQQQEQWLNQRVDKLYRSPYPIAPSVNEVLADLCQFINTEHVILYYPRTNNPDIYEISYEWCADQVSSALQFPGHDGSYSLSELPEDLRLLLGEVQTFDDASKLLPSDDRKLLITKDDPIKALMHLPLFGADGLCGYLSIGCVHHTKQWSEQDQFLVQSIGNAITMIHNREQAHLQLVASQQHLQNNIQQEQWLNQRVDNLYRSPYPIAPCVNEVLADLSQLINVEHAVLYYPRIDNPGIYDLSYEWCADKISSVLELSELDGSYNITELPENLRLLLNEILIVNNVSELPSSDEINFLIRENNPVKSFMNLPLFGTDGLSGYMSVDCVHHTKQWSEQDQLVVQSIGNAITMAHNREQAHLQLVASQQHLQNNIKQEQWLNQRIDKLYRSPFPIAPCANEVIGELSQRIGAERTCLFYARNDNSNIYDMSYEWSTDGVPLLSADPEYLVTHNLTEFPESVRLLLNDIQAVNDISELSPSDDRQVFITENDPIKAFLNLPLFGSQGLCGYVFFDCINHTKQWTEQDKLVTQSIGNAITMIHYREQAHTELQLSQQRFSTAMEASKDGMWEWNLITNDLYFSPAYYSLIGYQDREIEVNAQVLIATCHPEDRESFSNEFKKISQNEIPFEDFHFRFMHKDGRTLWMHGRTTCSERDSTGKPVRITGVVSDISDLVLQQKKVEQARVEADKANTAKSEFLANMSHEIRTPMNAIIGLSYLTLQTELTTQQRDYTTKVSTASQSLLGIINDILDFSKIEAGKLDIEQSSFDLDEVLNDLSSLIIARAESKGTEIAISCPHHVPRHLIGDSLRLGQVLLNLAGNAIKFTEGGFIVLSITVADKTETSIELHFSLIDTGIGMTEEQKGKLFKSFSQADTSTTRKFGGTGLGLSISKQLVELMDGEIGVESEPGAGSNFTFTAKFGLDLERPNNELPSSDELRGKRILIVDDNETARHILFELAESLNFLPTVAASGKAALEEIQRVSEDPSIPDYDIVIMDWKMPELDGIETSRLIKNSTDSAPVIIMATGYDSTEVRKEAGNLLDGLLHKPVNASDLFNAIASTIGISTHTQASTREKILFTPTTVNLRGIRILLAEDNEINQQVARELLESQGCKVTIVDNGQKAVHAVKENPDEFDLILMDIQMPIMDGYRATAEIRKDHNIDTLPILAMTAHALTGEKEKSLSRGMNDHITKPINPNTLFTAIADWAEPKETAVSEIITEEKRTEEHLDSKSKLLPENLASFDLKTALIRVGGNQTLLHKLLIKFYDQYHNFSIALDKMINKDDLDNARIQVHTLKGAAGNLAAQAVYENAQILETALIAENSADITSAMPNFVDALSLSINATRKLKTDELSSQQKKVDNTSKNPEIDGQKSPIDKKLISDLCDELSLLLAKNSMKAKRLYPKLHDALSDYGFNKERSNIQETIEQLDFKTAGIHLASLIKKLENRE